MYCLIITILPGIAVALPSVAFYYGHNAPVDELHAFDVVVVDPDSGVVPIKFNDSHSKAYAYVSIGEWHGNKKIPNKKWIKAKNHTWNSYALDQSNVEWRKYVVEQLIAPLIKQGYQGVFFDTVDSYHLFAKSPEARAKQEAGLVELIKAVKKRFPKTHIILNRGFEIVPKVKTDIDGVAAESLYRRWDHAKKQYVAVPEKDSQWLKGQMQTVKKEGLWPIVIDYVNPVDTKKAQQVADKIKADGFIPWVANGELNTLGMGAVTVIPRIIDIVYDSKQFSDISVSDAMRYIAFPIEQMGYIAKMIDVNKPLPQVILKGRIAGVVVWLNGRNAGVENRLDKWLRKQMSYHIPIALFGNFMYLLADRPLANQLGMAFRDYTDKPPLKVVDKTKLIGFESRPYLTEASLNLILKQGKPQLTIADQTGVKSEVVAYTPWGGYVQSPFIVHQLSEKQTYWIINPFQFLRHALQLPRIPVADLTTKNGLRMLMVHIDGDGWASKSEWFRGPIAAESMRDMVLKKYRIPTTVSVVEGEVSPNGVYPKEAKHSMQAARDIFKMPWVEIATHTYSHPFKWQLLAKGKVGKDYNLPIKGYQYSPEREITGSARFIDKVLAPKGKKCKVILWSGDTNPDQAALEVAYKDHFLNMNGGDTLITKRNNTLTLIAPVGIYKGKYLQIYAPNQNENVYTNDWAGPFYGFRNVIQTFKLTESPHRYKPIDIYYHTYSASKKGALRALYQVYDWALAQHTNKIYSSEYIKRARSFFHVVIARQRNHWLLRHLGDEKEFHVPSAWGGPQISHNNVLGYNSFEHFNYIHLGDNDQAEVTLNDHPSKLPYIVEVNGDVKHLQRTQHTLHFDLQASEPLRLVMNGMGGCKLNKQSKPLKPTQNIDHGELVYQFKQSKVKDISVSCL